jgi:hypothetical protein
MGHSLIFSDYGRIGYLWKGLFNVPVANEPVPVLELARVNRRGKREIFKGVTLSVPNLESALLAMRDQTVPQGFSDHITGGVHPNGIIKQNTQTYRATVRAEKRQTDCMARLQTNPMRR